jgi:hypothetical protein
MKGLSWGFHLPYQTLATDHLNKSCSHLSARFGLHRVLSWVFLSKSGALLQHASASR